MKKSEVKIERATIAHAKEFYGEQYSKSFKGYSALIDGKVVGMGGLAYEKGKMLLFSDIKDELRPYKKDIWRGIDMLGEMVKNAKIPIVAVANKNEKRSEELLTMLGLKPNGQAVPEGKIYWRIP